MNMVRSNSGQSYKGKILHLSQRWTHFQRCQIEIRKKMYEQENCDSKSIKIKKTPEKT